MASWEWMLERALRRSFTLAELSGAAVDLSEWASKYRVSPLAPFLATHIEGQPPMFPVFASGARLPDWGSEPPGSALDVAAPEVLETVWAVLSSGGAASGQSAASYWADPAPEAWPSSSRSVDASYAETAYVDEPPHDVAASQVAVEVRTTVQSAPLDPSFLPVFRLLGDRRLDDGPSDVRVPLWDASAGEFSPVSARSFPVFGPVEPSTDPYRGEFVAVVSRECGRPVRRTVKRQPGLTGLSASFAFPCRVHSDLGDLDGTFSFPSTSYAGASVLAYARYVGYWMSGEYREPARLGDLYPYRIGSAEEAPAAERGGMGFVDAPDPGSASRDFDAGRVHPAPDWDGRPTYWAAAGFPVPGPSPSGSAVAAQLSALRSAQPCPPSGLVAQPSSGESPADASARHAAPADGWPPVLPPDAPAQADALLGALQVTVTEVPCVFADVELDSSYSVSETVSSEESTAWSWTPGHPQTSAELPDDDSHTRTETRTESGTRSVRGTYCGPFDGLLGLLGRAEEANASLSGSEDWSYASTDVGAYMTGVDEASRNGSRTESRTVSFVASGLKPVFGAGDGGSVRTVSSGSSSLAVVDSDEAEPGGEDREYEWEDDVGEAGSGLPEGARAMLGGGAASRWLKRAELVAVVDCLCAAHGGTASYEKTSDSDGTKTREARVTGGRTSRRRVLVRPLGLSGGSVARLDVREFVADARPSGPSGFAYDPDYDQDWWHAAVTDAVSRTSDSRGDGSFEETREVAVETPETSSASIVSARLFLVAEWDFGDRPLE